MPNEIFISYVRQDLEFVRQLHENVTARGFSAWFDTEENPGAMHTLIKLDPIIRASKVLVLVLSPDALASKDVNDHLHRAKNLYAKPIISLIWRAIPADLPKPMQSHLIGLKKIDFAETASPENFNKLADVLSQHIAVTTAITLNISSEATEIAGAKGDKIIMGSVISSTHAPSQAEAPGSSGRRLGALTNKLITGQKTISPLALGAQVISLIVIPLELDLAVEETVTAEIRWLFRAVDHLLALRHNQIPRSQPISEPIPAQAQTLAAANNQLLNTLDEAALTELEEACNSFLNQLNTWLNKNLGQLLDRETRRGEAGKGDGELQSQIKDMRIQAVKSVQQLAETMDRAYGIRVSGYDQLLEALAGQVNPILLGSGVVSKVIVPLGLSSEDEAFVTAEVRWLFSAADNYLRICQAVVKKLIEEKKKLIKSGLPRKSFKEALTKRLPQIRQEEIELAKPVGLAIPADSQKLPEATNRLLNLPDKNEVLFYLDVRQGIVYDPLKNLMTASFDRIRSQLQVIDTLTQRETKMGEEGHRNIELQNALKGSRLYIIKVLQEMAQQMNEAYGVQVTTPTQLLELLET